MKNAEDYDSWISTRKTAGAVAAAQARLARNASARDTIARTIIARLGCSPAIADEVARALSEKVVRRFVGACRIATPRQSTLAILAAETTTAGLTPSTCRALAGLPNDAAVELARLLRTVQWATPEPSP